MPKRKVPAPKTVPIQDSSIGNPQLGNPQLANARLANAQFEDARLVNQCLAGHEDAWRGFVDRFREPVWHIAYRFCGGPDDADELTQDIFMRLVTVLPRYRPSGALGAWVRQVATNVAIDSYRRRRRTPVLVPDEEMVEPPVPASWQPDAIAERREEAARIRTLMDRLPAELSEPLILRDLMDCDYPEISERLGIPLGTVKSRIHRGRQTLARARREFGRSPGRAREAANR